LRDLILVELHQFATSAIAVRSTAADFGLGLQVQSDFQQLGAMLPLDFDRILTHRAPVPQWFLRFAGAASREMTVGRDIPD
jgi:hypothetical protein